MSPEEASTQREQKILKDRARQLAQPIEDHLEGRNEREVIIFTLKPETYAIDCRFVRAVARSATVSQIPGTPAFVVGVTRVRGEIHSVFDLRAILGAPHQPHPSDAMIIAIGEHAIEFCLLADDVSKVSMLPSDRIHKRNTENGNERSFIEGVTTDAMMVIDAAQLLRDQKLYVGNTARS